MSTLANTDFRAFEDKVPPRPDRSWFKQLRGSARRAGIPAAQARRTECDVVERPKSVSAAFESSEDIAAARDLARDFLESLQAVHGLPVSKRVMGMGQLVVSELVTNARKYAPGPCLLTLEVSGGPSR